MFNGLKNMVGRNTPLPVTEPASASYESSYPHIRDQINSSFSEYAPDDLERDSEDNRATIIDYTKHDEVQDKMNEVKNTIRLVQGLRGVHEEIVKCLVKKCDQLTLESILLDYMNIRKKIKSRVVQLKNDGFAEASKQFYNETRKIRELIYADICSIINDDLANIGEMERYMPTVSKTNMSANDTNSYCRNINKTAQFFYKNIYGYPVVPDPNNIMEFRDQSISQFIEPQSDLPFLHNKCLGIRYEKNVKYIGSRVRDFFRGTSKMQRTINSQTAGRKRRRTRTKRTKRAKRTRRSKR